MRATPTTLAIVPNPIRQRRLQLGLSLRGLAAIAGVSAPAVYYAEVGRCTLPAKLLRGLCDATGEPYERLLEDWLAWRTGGIPGRIERLTALIRVAYDARRSDGGLGE